MATIWFVVLMVWGWRSGFAAVPTFAWLLLVPFGIRGAKNLVELLAEVFE